MLIRILHVDKSTVFSELIKLTAIRLLEIWLQKGVNFANVSIHLTASGTYQQWMWLY